MRGHSNAAIRTKFTFDLSQLADSRQEAILAKVNDQVIHFFGLLSAHQVTGIYRFNMNIRNIPDQHLGCFRITDKFVILAKNKQNGY